MYEMKRRKGDGYVTETYELNRLDYMILDTLYHGGFKDYYHGITIAEMMELNRALGARMTVYKKLQKLVKAGYIKKGLIDNHSDTYYYVEEKKIKTIEGGN